MAISAETLKKLLIQGNVITEGEFSELESEAKRSDISIIRLLISQGRLNQQYLSELISKFFNIPIFRIRSSPPDAGIMELVPEEIARKRQILIFGKNPETNAFKAAMIDPTDIDNVNFLEEYLKGEIEPHVATMEDLKIGYQFYQRKASEGFEAVISAKIRELNKTIKGGSNENLLENIPLAELFDSLLDYGSILDASDIFFQPEEEMLRVRFRVDGLLRDILLVGRIVNEGLVARVKTLANMRIDEHMKPQDGRFRFHSNNVDIDVRCAIMPTFFGEKVTLRLLAGSQSFLSFEELGMPLKITEKMQSALKKPFGMILSSGPTGSGKTTTIYSIMYLINKPEVHITTIEDPIEYIIPNVSQTQVNIQADITFASGLRALLRHSPDVILIGEIRDSDTAEISMNAALTGHLLISTIHTNDAPSAIIRLINLGIPPFLIGATLNAVLAQRLVRKICVNCIESYSPPEIVLKQLQEQISNSSVKTKMSKGFFHGKGCSICGHTGYKGRVGIFEIFIIDELVRNLINKGTVNSDNLKKIADDQGMTPMIEDGLAKIEVGITTPEEVLRVVSEQQ